MIETSVQVRTPHVYRHDGPDAAARNDGAPLSPTPEQDQTGRMPGPVGVVCRKLRTRDLRHLVSNYRLVHVDQPDSLIDRTGPLGMAMRGLRPFSRLRPITNLAFSSGDRFLAFAQFRQVGPDQRWVVTGVGLANGLFTPERVVQELLEFSVVRAGKRGVKRLFARVSSDSPIRAAFAQIGFEAYMSEDLFALDGQPELAGMSGGLREQEQTDTWAVHQLYHAAVPAQVQFAEAWTSHQWDTSAPKRNSERWRSFVQEDGHQIVAFARVRTGAKAASIEFMYLPDHHQELDAFCGGVIDLAIREGGATRVFIPARAYQAELMTILERMGFARVGHQELLIKYTTAKVVAKPSEAVIRAPAEVRERVPKRVPTFLNRRSRENNPA